MRSGADPDGAVLVVGLEPRQELGEPLLELALERPGVEVDPEALERDLDPAQHLRNGVSRSGRELRDVRAAIAALGWLFPAPRRLDGGTKALHLGAGVVVVVLALDLVPGERKQAGDAVAIGAVARRRDDDRAGGIGRDHFDLSPLRHRRRATAVAFSGGEDLGERLTIDRRCDPQVDEPRPRNLSPIDPRNTQHIGKLSLSKLSC